MDEVSNDEFIFVEDKELGQKSNDLRKEFCIRYWDYGLTFNRLHTGGVYICYEKLDGKDIEKDKLREMQEFLGTLLEKYKVV